MRQQMRTAGPLDARNHEYLIAMFPGHRVQPLRVVKSDAGLPLRHEALVLTVSSSLGFSDCRLPFMATISGGSSWMKIKVSPIA